MSQDDQDKMQGVEMVHEEDVVQPLFTDQEKRVLEVYDRLEELQLEIALLKARGILPRDEPAEVSESDIEQAQHELLQAKAAYQVRNNVIEGVLVANPVLKAVHGGNNASSAERDLLPLIEQRDKLSVTLTDLSTKVLAARNELISVESENVMIAHQNAELAGEMLSLAGEANIQRKEDINDPKARERLDELEAEVNANRKKWRIIKGTVSGTIVGSGVDWTRDSKLLEIVLDNDGIEG